MADVANCGRSKQNKGLMAITVITETTAVKSGNKIRIRNTEN